MSEWLWCAFDGHISLVGSRVKRIGMLLYLWKICGPYSQDMHLQPTKLVYRWCTAQIASLCLPVVCMLTLIIINVLFNKVLVALCLVPFGNADIVS